MCTYQDKGTITRKRMECRALMRLPLPPTLVMSFLIDALAVDRLPAVLCWPDRSSYSTRTRSRSSHCHCPKASAKVRCCFKKIRIESDQHNASYSPWLRDVARFYPSLSPRLIPPDPPPLAIFRRHKCNTSPLDSSRPASVVVCNG